MLQENEVERLPPSPCAPTVAAAQGGPGSTLGNVLAAACSQDQVEFTRFLTARNQEAYSRMTPAARVALLKRFVLLNEPGKAAISANPSGRPIVRCETPGATTETQIGGAEIHDHVAFLPLEIHDVSLTVRNDPLPTLLIALEGNSDVAGVVKVTGSLQRAC